MCYCLGLASDLHRMPQNEIEKKRLQVAQEVLDERKRHVKYPPTDDELPVMTREQLRQRVSAEGKQQQPTADSHQQQLLIALDGYVLDVTKFRTQHPGGDAYLRAFNGKDATAAFHGVVNTHTVGSTNMAHMFRVARLAD
jgi:stearoyl-CoA desaturase (Delta-9 desaturase)